MIEWLLDTLKGLALLAVLYLLILLYVWFTRISEEDSPRGRLFEKIGNITSSTFFIYFAILSVGVPLIALIIWLFT